jgi:hypothetical protein
MPTVLCVDGFAVMIYTHDHLPQHIHVFKGEESVIIALQDLSLRSVHMTNPNVRKAIGIVNANQDFLIAEWERISPVP